MGNGVDQTSIGMATATIMLQVVSEATKSDAIFFMGIATAISTIVYNIVKTSKILKKDDDV